MKNGGGPMVQAASLENIPHSKTSGEGGQNPQKGTNRKAVDKDKEKDKGADKNKSKTNVDKDAKTQQMAQPWRHSTEGDKIRVQSRHVKKH